MITLASRRAGIVAALCSVTALVAAGCSSSGADTTTEQGFPETITLAAIPAENSTDLRASYDPVIERLQRETGATVEFVQASDYAGVVEGLIAGNVDLAFFGPFAYVVAGINGADMTPLGAVVQDEGTPPDTSPTESPARTTRPSTPSPTTQARRCASSTRVPHRDSCTRPRVSSRKASSPRDPRATSPQASRRSTRAVTTHRRSR